MQKLEWWNKALGSWFKLKDEVTKVSQLGKAGLNRSFLIHERLKLTALLGEHAYRWVLEKGTQDPVQKRLVDQIEKLKQRISQIDQHVTGITQDLSQKLDAEEGNDLLNKKNGPRKFRIRRKKK